MEIKNTKKTKYREKRARLGTKMRYFKIPLPKFRRKRQRLSD